MRGPALSAIALVLLSAPAAAAADDFSFTFRPGEPPLVEAPGVTATLINRTEGELELWRLETTKPHLVGVVASEGYFNVTRPRQVLPEVDDRFFGEVPAGDVGPGAARLVNLTQAGPNVTLRLAFHIENGSALLRLSRDVAPPEFSIGPVQNLTHNRFYVETRTNEHALANLRIQPQADGDVVANPTTTPALVQRFPVQGLKPATAYLFDIEFRDWSGNVARSSETLVRTADAPILPGPTVTARHPPREARLSDPVGLLWVEFEGAGPHDLGHVSVFVDKYPRTDGVNLVPGRVTVVLARPLGPGAHSAAFELRTPEGGVTVDRWSFEVASGLASVPPAAALVALVAASLMARPRGRGPRGQPKG